MLTGSSKNGPCAYTFNSKLCTFSSASMLGPTSLPSASMSTGTFAISGVAFATIMLTADRSSIGGAGKTSCGLLAGRVLPAIFCASLSAAQAAQCLTHALNVAAKCSDCNTLRACTQGC